MKKTGLALGVRAHDEAGDAFFLKFDRRGHDEVETGADLVVQRLLFAAGYNVAENDIVYVTCDGLSAESPLNGGDILIVKHAATGADLPWAGIGSFPKLRGLGWSESARFDPSAWKPNYPWIPFEKADRLDRLWGARLVASFTPAQIRAAVVATRYSDPRTVDYRARARRAAAQGSRICIPRHRGRSSGSSSAAMRCASWICGRVISSTAPTPCTS